MKRLRSDCIGLALSALLAAGPAPLLAEDGAVRVPYEDAGSVAAGSGIYRAHCAACHGDELEGAPDWQTRDSDGYMPAPPHDETGHTWHHPDAQLFMVVKYGTEKLVGNGYRSRMGGYDGILSDAEILQVLAYIKAQWPPRVIATHNRINASAQPAAD